jgi:hypothetical protein
MVRLLRWRIECFTTLPDHEDLTEGIIGCGIRVHEALGLGAGVDLSSCMILELQASGYTVDGFRPGPSWSIAGRMSGAVFLLLISLSTTR